MTQAEIQTLGISATFFQGIGEPGLMAMQVYLLWLAQHPAQTMTFADVQALRDSATCLAACMTHKELLASTVQLLNAGGGGGGGGGTIQIYTGTTPPAAPANPAAAALFYPDDVTLPFQAWTPGGTGWTIR